MRTDASVSRLSFRHSQQWSNDPLASAQMTEIDRRLSGSEIIDGKLVIHSLSGHERNHLFLNQQGKQFADVSTISGLDNPADSRGFVLFDYDHDGQQDIALVNANDPLLNLYRNQVDAVRSSDRAHHFIAIRFVGGNHSPSPSKFACRDGYGAIVSVKLGEVILKREHRCGEGYGTQNSSTMIVGIGDRDRVDSVQVRWPSGATAHAVDIAAGNLVTVFENPPDGTDAIAIGEYPPVRQRDVTPADSTFTPRLRLDELSTKPPLEQPTQRRPRLYLTTATWCVACVEHLPHIQHLVDTFGEQVEFIGLPIDPEDDAQKLERFIQQFAPPYHLALHLKDTQRAEIADLLSGIVPPDAVPAALITDAEGRVRLSTAGVPTVSDIRQALDEQALR